MKSRLFYLYVLSMPFSYAFSMFGGRLTISLLISIVMLLFLAFHIVAIKSSINRKALIYTISSILFCIYVFFNSAITDSFNLSSFSHTISYIVSIFFFFTIPLLYIDYFKQKINNEKVFFSIFVMVLFSSFYTVIQFIMNNVFQINLDNFISWPSVDLSNATFLGTFYRAKGFSAEAGHFAFFLECFIPLVFYYLFVSNYSRLSKLLKVTCFIIIIASLLFTVSAAAFSIIPIAILIAVVLNYNLLRKSFKQYIVKIFIALFIIFFVVSIFKSVLPIYDMIFTSTVDKLDSTSSDDRLSRLSLFSDMFTRANFFETVFGYGPAATTKLGFGDTTILLLYPLIIIELGLFGLLILLIVFLQFFLKSYNLDGKFRFFFHISLFSLFIHYFFISNYWYPYIWFLGILPCFLERKFVDK